MANPIKDLRDLLLALQINQSHYKYTLIKETNFSVNKKKLYDVHSIVKFHKEKKQIGENIKVVKIQDASVRGDIPALLLYLVKEYNEMNNT